MDKKWQKVIDDIHVKLNEFVKMLKGRDASAVLSIKLENKASFLYSIMGDYCQSEAYEIRNMADYIDKMTHELMDLQASAVK